MLVFNCTTSKKGSWYGTRGLRGKKVCSVRNGKVREGIWSVLVYTLECESEKVHLWARMHVYEEYSAEKHKGKQWSISNCYEKEWGWWIVHSPFLASAVKKINRPFNLCSPQILLYWPFISSFPSQPFTSSIWLMNMQMYSQFYNSLSFLKTGYKFGS